MWHQYQEHEADVQRTTSHVVVLDGCFVETVFGASGDLAKKMVSLLSPSSHATGPLASDTVFRFGC
jgi:hypothetical protein